jgi:hypothetical protein
LNNDHWEAGIERADYNVVYDDGNPRSDLRTSSKHCMEGRGREPLEEVAAEAELHSPLDATCVPEAAAEVDHIPRNPNRADMDNMDDVIVAAEDTEDANPDEEGDDEDASGTEDAAFDAEVVGRVLLWVPQYCAEEEEAGDRRLGPVPPWAEQFGDDETRFDQCGVSLYDDEEPPRPPLYSLSLHLLARLRHFLRCYPLLVIQVFLSSVYPLRRFS